MTEKEKTEIEVVDKKSLSPEARKDYNKKNWIQRIALKRAQNIPLDNDDWSFLITMQYSSGNDDYARLIRVEAELAQKAIEDLKYDLDPDTYIKALQGQIHLKSALYRNMKQGQRDDAATRKMDVDTLNKYSKMAEKKGFDASNPVRVKIEEAMNRKMAEMKVIDATKNKQEEK